MTQDSLFEQLKHPNPHLRQRAMIQMAEERDDATIPRLMAILDDENIEYRRASVQALGVVGIDAVPPLVAKLQASEDATVRSCAVKAMAQIALNYPELAFPETGMQGLKVALNDPSPVVHIAAAMALGEIGEPALDLLLDSLQTSDNLALQIAVLNAVGSLGDPRAAEVLSNLANDASADPYLQESAASALSRLELVGKYQAGVRPKE